MTSLATPTTETAAVAETAENLQTIPPLYFMIGALLLIALIAGIVLICLRESRLHAKARTLIQENQFTPHTRLVLILKISALLVLLLGIAFSIAQPHWVYPLPDTDDVTTLALLSLPLSVDTLVFTLLGSIFASFLLYTIAISLSLQNQQAMLLEYHSRMLQHLYAELTTGDRSAAPSDGMQQSSASKNQMLILNSHSEVLNYHSQMLQYLSQVAGKPESPSTPARL